jgi:acyl-CoA thioesterase-1
MSPDAILLACVGDSLTQGYGVGPGRDWPSLVQEKLAADNVNVDMANFGVSGDTCVDVLERMPPILEAGPDAAVVALGANDFMQGYSPEVFHDNLRRIVDRLRGIGAKVGLAGFSAADFEPTPRAASFQAVYTALAGEQGLPLYADLLEGVSGNPELLLDLVHPNSRGYAVIAENILPFIKRLVASA